MNIGAAFGAAGLAAALTRPFTATGKKSSSRKKLKKAKKRCQSDLAACEAEAELCIEQRRQCVALFTDPCEGDAACIEQIRRLCAPLGACNIGAFLRGLS